MLAPDDRYTLLDALRPPSGHRLDLAVGTTFSMHLDALLTAPAAFAFFDVGDVRARNELEPVELLDSIHRHADRIRVFCQAGQISIPAHRRLFTFLEDTVIPVVAPRGGVFHPKVWVLRFLEPAGEVYRYRVLCATRNLTYDRSWDTMLRLDSTDMDNPREQDVSGLAEFLRALPGMTVGSLSGPRRAEIEELADQVSEVTFALPDGCESLRFWPLGIGRAPLPVFPPDAERLAVVSPFLTEEFLEKLPAAKSRRVLVSRAESMDAVGPKPVKRFSECYELADDATLPGEAADGAQRGRPSTDDPGEALSGLHAKLYVFDRGPEAVIFTGSANATSAAFGSNVEMLVELQGPKGVFGVERLLEEPRRDVTTLRSLLVTYTPPTEAVPPDESQSAANRLDALRRELAEVPLRATVGEPNNADVFAVMYQSTRPLPQFPAGVTLRCWPVTVHGADAADPFDEAHSLDARFELSLEALTSFLACELSDGDVYTRFVLTAELIGAPEDRKRRLLRLMIGDAARLLRYLLLLLSDETSDRFELGEVLDRLERGAADDQQEFAPGIPLLEAMLRSLVHEPARLDRVDQVITDLVSDAGDDDLLPDRFHEVWDPIWSVAKELRG